MGTVVKSRKRNLDADSFVAASVAPKKKFLEQQAATKESAISENILQDRKWGDSMLSYSEVSFVAVQ